MGEDFVIQYENLMLLKAFYLTTCLYLYIPSKVRGKLCALLHAFLLFLIAKSEGDKKKRIIHDHIKMV